MNPTEWMETIVSILGVGGVFGAVTASILYAKSKGITDALQKTAETYKGLYEAQVEENRRLKFQVEALMKEVSELRGEVRGRERSSIEWTKTVLSAMAESGICADAWTCKNRRLPNISSEELERG